MRREYLGVAVGIALLLAQSGCETLDQVSKVGTTIGLATGTIDTNQAASINKMSSAVGKTFDSITPEQEYYIGRAVAATILSKYRPWDNPRANEYLNVLGQSLAVASDKPETFGGYHFLILDTDEINGFAAPGGLIFITRGLLRCCRNEDSVAAVLAHEISHVTHQHGLQAISKERLTSALTVLATESGKAFGGQNVAELTRQFEGSISDITSTMINNGYSRKLEYQADGSAVVILKRVGYDPHALVDMLQDMDKRLAPGGAGFGHTHPPPKSRIAEVQSAAGAGGAASAPAQASRTARWKEALGGV